MAWPMAEDTGVRSVLANRPFLALWLAQLLSQTAQNAILFALLVLIEQRTKSTVFVSLLILSAIVPAIFFGIAAGVVVDHVRKKMVLLTTNLLRAIACLGFVAFSGSLELLYAVNFLFSSISQFFAPAETAAIPMLVKRGQLVAANALFNLTFTGAQVLGFVLIGPTLPKLVGPEGSFLVIAVIYAIAALLVSLLPSREPPYRPFSEINRSALVPEVGRDLREGWGMLRGDPAISLATLQLTAIIGLIFVLAALAPGYANRVLGGQAQDAVLILAPVFVGILTAAGVLPWLTRRVQKPILVNVGLVGLAPTLALLALAGELLPVFHDIDSLLGFIMASAFLIGLGIALINIPAQTILQERTPETLRGRVFAIQLTFAFVASIVPLLFVAALADWLGPGRTVLLMAVGVLALAVYSLVQTRRRELQPAFEPNPRPH